MIHIGDLQPPSTWVIEWETIRQPSSKVFLINNLVQITELDGIVLTSFPSSSHPPHRISLLAQRGGNITHSPQNNLFKPPSTS